MTTIHLMVRNSTGAWETIETETATLPVDFSTMATISANDIGGEPGQLVRIEVRDANGNVLDSIETESV